MKPCIQSKAQFLINIIILLYLLLYSNQIKGFVYPYLIKFNKDTGVEYFNQNFIRFDNFIYKKNIKTLLIYKEGWELSHPIIDLKSEEKVKLSFDDLDAVSKDYYYKVIHCNSNWEPSDLSYNDYTEGFEINQIIDNKISFNTFQKYIHYNLVIPNNDLKLKISGNYIIKVFEDYDEEKIVLTARFYCVEHNASIEAGFKRALSPAFNEDRHEIDFVINTRSYISNPQSDLKVVLKQNNRDDNAIRDLKPLFIQGNELKYDYSEENTFSANTEFLYFDIKSVRFQSERIHSIEYIKPFYNVNLILDNIQRFKPYIFNNDLNGNFLVKVQEYDDSENEADYVFVNFYLNYPEPVVDGNIYVFGKLSNWKFDNSNKMIYNYNLRRYELQMFLKQGYYNYSYAFVKDGEKNADLSFINGSHYETENEYNIYVYYRDISAKYDKLIGYQTVNSNYKK